MVFCKCKEGSSRSILLLLMGLLSVGTPLSWKETKVYADFVREHGIQQFINQYHKLKDRQNDCLKWGDEIEYMIIEIDDANKRVHVSLRADYVLSQLMASEDHDDPTKNEFLWRPEYANYMIEGTPGLPYGGLLACFNHVEHNMRRRRSEAKRLLKPTETLLTIGNFPRLGCPGFTHPFYCPTTVGGVSNSLFFPDEAIYSAHPRFRTLTRNIRERRGEKVIINVPIFRDEKTPTPFREDFSALGDDGQAARGVKDDHIYMDAMGFGMGCCCLQVTFQAVNVGEARWLYDQLTPVTPIVLALSAATPIFRGYLADVDCRWNIISASVDDRTEEERGLKPLQHDRFVIPKSRYDTTECYLYSCSAVYNDIPLVYDQALYEKLVSADIDELLAKHIAHLFIRDPVQLYSERVQQNDEESTEHFETIQSSNWMNMRFKPPPQDGAGIGWRVEFRPMEVQLTDFENAALVTFVVLLTRVIISLQLSLIVPISKVNENMERAQKRDAVRTQKFYFRKGVSTCNTPPETQRLLGPCGVHAISKDAIQAEYVEMSIDEIINGKPPDFPGLVPMMQQYLDAADVDVDTRCTINQYLRFIQLRAGGQLWTLAHWMREFVRAHPLYQKDSVVSETICYDLVRKMDDIANERAHCAKLLGDFRTKDPAVDHQEGASVTVSKANQANTSELTRDADSLMQNGVKGDDIPLLSFD